MEADWAVEIGPHAPIIVVPWEGFVDLRLKPLAAVEEISEAADHPPLRDALVRLNSATSDLFTSKCDAWWLNQEEIDTYEFGAQLETPRFGYASYIDVLFVHSEKFRSFPLHEQFVRRLTEELRTLEHSNCRVDLVVRSATFNSSSGYGVTLYAAGCGKNQFLAQLSWQRVLQTTVKATMKMSLPFTAGE